MILCVPQAQRISRIAPAYCANMLNNILGSELLKSFQERYVINENQSWLACIPKLLIQLEFNFKWNNDILYYISNSLLSDILLTWYNNTNLHYAQH